MSELVLPHSIDAGTEIVANEHQSNYVAIRDVINGQLEGGGGSSNNFKANGVTARELADNLLLRGIPAQNMQEGVVAAGDLLVTPGAGLVLNYAAGTAWVTDDSGVLAAGALIPVTVTASTVTIAANASGNPRIDQIILTMTGHGTGTVSILQGTASVGATLANRTGAAALPSDAVRLADILMPNGFAGPFVQATHIRDRRPWARGLNKIVNRSSGDISGITSTNYVSVDSAVLYVEGEFSGGPVEIVFSYNVLSAAALATFTAYSLDSDLIGGAANTTRVRPSNHTAAYTISHDHHWRIPTGTIPAGWHRIEPIIRVNASSITIFSGAVNGGIEFSVRESVIQDAHNDGA